MTQTQEEPGRFRFTTVELCPGCRRWVIHPNGMPLRPWLPENVHVVPQTVGGGP